MAIPYDVHVMEKVAGRADYLFFLLGNEGTRKAGV
jgi:hypothetical protein